MAKITLSTANKAQLVAYAVENIGISEEEADAYSKEQLKQFIIENDVDDDPEADAPKLDAAPAKKKEEPRVRIIVHEQEGIGGTDDVVVGVNGNVTRIKRGHEVLVKQSVVDVLEDAVITTFVPNPEVPGAYTVRKFRRFNFSRV